MDATRTLAIIGAVTGSIGTATGLSALMWDLYKWKHQTRPVLEITALPNMSFMPPGGPFLPGMPAKDDKLIQVRVVNIGHGKTTLTILGLAYFNTKPNRKLTEPAPPRFVILNHTFEKLPKVLEPGEQWNGLIDQSNEVVEMARNGYLYALVEHTLGRLSTEGSSSQMKCWPGVLASLRPRPASVATNSS